jgi:heme/copper-type cytochrome/quinol oxidase subunit 2
MALELWILMSILVYYTVITKEDLMSDKLLVVVIIITGVIFSLIKYFVFDRKDQWKDYVQEFDKWPKRKNNIGTLVAWVVVLLIIGNLVFSFYLMSLINWKQYR